MTGSLDLRAVLRIFVTTELDRVEPAGLGDHIDGFDCLVHEHSDRLPLAQELLSAEADDRARLARRDIAMARSVEDESKKVRPRLQRDQPVRGFLDPADLDSRH